MERCEGCEGLRGSEGGWRGCGGCLTLDVECASMAVSYPAVGPSEWERERFARGEW